MKKKPWEAPWPRDKPVLKASPAVTEMLGGDLPKLPPYEFSGPNARMVWRIFGDSFTWGGEAPRSIAIGHVENIKRALNEAAKACNSGDLEDAHNKIIAAWTTLRIFEKELIDGLD